MLGEGADIVPTTTHEVQAQVADNHLKCVVGRQSCDKSSSVFFSRIGLQQTSHLSPDVGATSVSQGTQEASVSALLFWVWLLPVVGILHW